MLRPLLALFIPIVLLLVPFGTLFDGSPQRTAPGVRLCQERVFGGRCEVFRNEVANLEGSTVGDNHTSSVSVAPGYVVSVYEHPNFVGRCQVFAGDTRSLMGTYIGDGTVSSLQFGLCGIQLCEGVRYEGRCQSFATDSPDLTSSFVGNDAVSSVRLSGIPNSGVVSLYEETDYRGRCQTFYGDVPNLEATMIGNRTASSVRVGSACP